MGDIEGFDDIPDVVSRVVGRTLGAKERSLIAQALAEGITTQEGLIEYARERDASFGAEIDTGRYLDAILDAAKVFTESKLGALMAREYSSPFFLIGHTRHDLTEVTLGDITAAEEPAQAEIARALRDRLTRERATGCVVVASTFIYPEGEVEPTTGERRRMDALFAIAIAKGGTRSMLLPLDGGHPLWHDFAGVATGLEDYVALHTSLAELP